MIGVLGSGGRCIRGFRICWVVVEFVGFVEVFKKGVYCLFCVGVACRCERRMFSLGIGNENVV